jgi:hypothetical protein
MVVKQESARPVILFGAQKIRRELMTEVKNPFDFPTLNNWARIARESADPEWLVDRLVPSQGFVLLSGAPKISLKTWFLKAVGLAVSTGNTVGPLVPVNKQGLNTLAILQEGALKPSGRRFDMLSKGMAIDIEQATKFYVGHRVKNLFLDDPTQVENLLDWCLDKEIQLLLLDPLAQVFRGDENSAQAIGKVMHAIKRFVDEKITVICSHHLSKNSNDVQRDIDADIRGSSALAGAYDAHLALRVSEGDRWLKMQCRYKDDEERGYNVVWHIDKDKADATLQMHEQDVENLDEPVLAHMSQVLIPGAMYTEGRLRKLWNCNDKIMLKTVDILVQQGILELVGSGKWAATKLKGEGNG